MKSTLIKMILVTTIFSMSSCTEVNKRVDRKLGFWIKALVS